VIRIIGSSSTLSPNIAAEKGYVSILSSNFPTEEVLLFGKKRSTTFELLEFLEASLSKKSKIIHFLHFRADEWLILSDKSELRMLEKIVLPPFLNQKYSGDGKKYPSKLWRLMCKIVLITVGRLRTSVSRESQFNNYRQFLNRYSSYEHMNIVIFDTKMRFLSPFIENFLRSRRSTYLQRNLQKSTDFEYIDYAELGINKNHFQEDRLHLNEGENSILGVALTKLICEKLLDKIQCKIP